MVSNYFSSRLNVTYLLTVFYTCLPLRLTAPGPRPPVLGSPVWLVWPWHAVPPAGPRGHPGPAAHPSHWPQNPLAPWWVYARSLSYQRGVYGVISTEIQGSRWGVCSLRWTWPLLQIGAHELQFVCQYGAWVYVPQHHLWTNSSLLECMKYRLHRKRRLTGCLDKMFTFLSFSASLLHSDCRWRQLNDDRQPAARISRVQGLIYVILHQRLLHRSTCKRMTENTGDDGYCLRRAAVCAWGAVVSSLLPPVWRAEPGCVAHWGLEEAPEARRAAGCQPGQEPKACGGLGFWTVVSWKSHGDEQMSVHIFKES